MPPQQPAETTNGPCTSLSTAKPQAGSVLIGARGLQPQSLDDAWRVASIIHASNLAPSSFKTKEQVFTAIQFGAELGFGPMQALQGLAVINGKVAMWGDALLALVRASGLLAAFEETEVGHGDDKKAICKAVRRDTGETIERSFSVADAKLAKLWGKRGRDGQDTPWITYPWRMLQMRARAFCLRDGFADVLRGISVAEEVQDYQQPAERKSIDLTTV